jgi:CO/xanthine dehydrogenase Mo-binding subunit
MGLAEPEWRVEGHLKVTGRAQYTADFAPPGLLWARYLVSTRPHARIVRINTRAAAALPGVHAVLTGADIGPRRFGRRLLDWPILAYERVRFIGERVAAVAAETPEIAESAVRLIEVEYEDLPAIFDPLQALSADAPVLHPDAAEYTFLGGDRPKVPHPNVQGRQVVTKGEPDIEAALGRSARVFEHTFTTQRQHHGFIEPHGALVWIADDGTVQVISTNKAPFALREQMAASLGMPQDNIVVDNGFIGGDFGGKGLSIDEYPAYYLARASGRPVRSVMSYVDELQGSNPRHSSVIRLRTGVDASGRFVAHHAQVWLDAGAYAAGKPAPRLILGGALATLGAYQVPSARFEVQTVYTNNLPGGHQRAPGEPQALFAGESHVDIIARELGIDPLEFRVRNAMRPGDTSPSGGAVREVRAIEIWERLRKETGWGRPLPAHHGRGLAMGLRHVGGGKTSVYLRLLPSGKVEILHNSPDPGGGNHTVAVRVAAAALSVDASRVVLRRGSTAEAPWDAGVGGSRTTHVLGRATLEAALDLKIQLEELAAETQGWQAGGVRLQDDHFVLSDGQGDSAPFEDVARRIARGSTVEASRVYDSNVHEHDEPGDYNFLAYTVEVEVDPETGAVGIVDAVLVADVGAIINPIAHQGQIHGGFMHGLGFALMEELVIDDGKVATLSLGEYKLPTQADMPRLRTVLLPTQLGPGPFGGKSAGELTNTAVAPAIANAVADAVGARVYALPITAEKVLAALK